MKILEMPKEREIRKEFSSRISSIECFPGNIARTVSSLQIRNARTEIPFLQLLLLLRLETEILGDCFGVPPNASWRNGLGPVPAKPSLSFKNMPHCVVSSPDEVINGKQ